MLIGRLLTILLSVAFATASIDEFSIYGPDVLQKTAIDTYLEARKADPANDKMTNDSPLMKRAQEHGVKRFVTKSAEDLKKKVKGSRPNDQLQLPMPDAGDRDSQLAASIINQATSDSTGGSESSAVATLVEQVNALAVAFNEDVGMGAISRSGALPMGENGDWLDYAEAKLLRDAQLGHQELMWELGSQIVENSQIASGGRNLTLEQGLMDDLLNWFSAGGGVLRYIQPVLTKDDGFYLTAKEDIQPGESVISIPMKLMMSRVTARNVLISNRGKYLGAELKATFEKDEMWGLAIFLLHEYYKEVNGDGSKWGPFVRSLRVRFLTTESLQALRGTTAADMSIDWMKNADKFAQWSTGHDGPCNPTTYICRTKPKERTGDNRFSLHQIRWAYWVVKQNAVRVTQKHTGNSYLALIPFYNMMEKRLGSGGFVSLERDNSVQVKVGEPYSPGEDKASTSNIIAIHPGDLTDAEYFMRYLTVPEDNNPNNVVRLNLPGTLPRGNLHLLCLKNPKEARRNDKCKGGEFRSGSVFWQSETLTKWRKEMNLPPRMTELMHAANKLHLFGDDKEEQKKMSAANALTAGLPLPTDVMSAEEQLLLMGVAKTNEEAVAMIAKAGGSNALSIIQQGGEGDHVVEAPTLYTAPDPNEDPEAKRAMEDLATLALQVQKVIASGNIMLNATRSVLNATEAFFEHGVLPEAGLDDLDDFLLKKIGMILHCGYSDDMKITKGNITEELFCAMRVHLMNETEVHTFCPADARIWNDNCQDVQFMNYTAISINNELAVISAFRNTLNTLLSNYPTTIDEDRERLRNHHADIGPPLSNAMHGAIQIALREKELLDSSLDFLTEYEAEVKEGKIDFQLELKMKERMEADVREAARQEFAKIVQERAKIRPPLATIEVNMGEGVPKQNLTIQEGQDLRQTVTAFCQKFGVAQENIPTLEKALKSRVTNPAPYALMLGVVNPLGDRRILTIPQIDAGGNATMETQVFCAKYNITEMSDCEGVLEKVQRRCGRTQCFPNSPVDEVPELKFARRVLLVVPVDAPDSRKLQIIVREGEQHDLPQLVHDFLEYYHMDTSSMSMLANEVHKRLPPAVLTIPVGLPNSRKVVARFAEHDNVTAVVEAFVNVYETDDQVKLQLLKFARAGLAPGTYVV